LIKIDKNNIKLIPRIIFQDQVLLALEKPAGIHVFSNRNDTKYSVCDWLLESFPKLASVGDSSAPAILHRLDRLTSGLLLVAKNNDTYQKLRDAFSKGMVKKKYLVLVHGNVKEDLDIQVELGSKYRRSKKLYPVIKGGKYHSVQKANSLIFPIEYSLGFTLCRVEMVTGVRHQIRAHMAYVGHPVVGDGLYGKEKRLTCLKNRFFLHAFEAQFYHPISKELTILTCPLSFDLVLCLQELGMKPFLD